MRDMAVQGRVWLATTLALFGIVGTSPDTQAQTTQYTFTKIADTVDNVGLQATSCVGLNNLGTVIVSFNGQLWQRRQGQPLTPVALISNQNCSSINDLDEIAYVVYDGPATNMLRLVRDLNGILTTLVTNFDVPALDAGSSLYLPSLSNSGSALYHGSSGPNGSGIGPGFYIAPSGITVYNSFAAPSLVVVPPASMNDSLVSVFLASDNSIGTGVTGIYLGGSTVPFIQTGDTVSGGGIFIPFNFRPVINNNGTVAFRATLNGTSGWFTTTNGVSATLVGTGPVDRIAINNSGRVAFRRADGIFAGQPGSVDEKVIAFGDPIDGSTFNGGFMWEEAINDAGQVAFWAELADGRRGVYRADPVNHPPVASNGTLDPLEDTQKVGTLSASDADGDSLTYIIVSNGTKGVATITDSSTGAFTYVPTQDQSGADSFTFQASDGKHDSNIATISVTIAPVNDAPVASNGAVSVSAGASVSGTLIASDIDGGALTFGIVANGTKGTATITNSATGAFTYTANIGSSGTDTFTFQASDGSLSANVATVTVTIQAGCATNVTGFVTSILGNLRVDRKTGHYLQKVTLKNTSSSTIAGPVSFVLDSLTAGTTVVGAAGVTACAAPAGSPYVTVAVGADQIFGTRERANVGLDFTLELTNPGTGTISYVPRVLAGAGGR
jgi:hypothetical protein